MAAVEIDGSEGEGGGQVLRTSLTLSAITKKPVRITNIRANRPNPGLQMQHLTSARAVRSVCRGKLTGAEPKSTELVFEPGEIVGGRYEFDIGTAGSVTLVAQTLIPILLGAAKESELRISGGTHVMKSPGYDYFEHVFVPAIARFGAQVGTTLIKPGYYPRGGGCMDVIIRPSKLLGCIIWPKEENVQALIRLSNLPEGIAVREKKVFVQNGTTDVHIRNDQSLSVGNAVTCWKGFRGAYVLGQVGKRAETVAQEALDMLKAEKNEVDVHLADQLLIYAALAEGRTAYTSGGISGHFRTNASIIAKFVERDIREEGGCVSIS
jgi:RNA 3'-terminal phosphate cyclase (ATP)